MAEYRTVKREIDTSRDESAASRWAIEYFRDNEHNLKGANLAKEEWAYLKRLLSAAKIRVIQHEGEQSIVVPGSTESLHRIDPDELMDLVEAAQKYGDLRDYLLAIAAAAIDNDQPLPGPLKGFVAEFLRSPGASGSRRGRPALHTRDQVISWAVAVICIRWRFSPTRNEATEEKASAISIVKTALGKVGIHLTEAAITKIWDKGDWKELLERISAK